MEVVKLRRRGGQIVQGADIYIGRRCTLGGWNLPASKWANPFSVREHGREKSLLLYEDYLRRSPDLLRALPELEGKILGCWCKPDSCHGDILIKLYSESVNKGFTGLI